MFRSTASIFEHNFRPDISQEGTQLLDIQTHKTQLQGARIFVPVVHEDDRGFFKETYNAARYKGLGLADEFVQDSVSFSTLNVIRGLHFDMQMSKFVQCLRGKIWDVIVDLRNGSSTFAKWEGFYLSEQNHRQLYIPPGFAHGFLALSNDVIFSYKHGAAYDPARERAIRWDDPQIGIKWPLVGNPRLSTKDQNNPLLKDVLF